MKKLYGDPEINISYFNGERIRTTAGDPVLVSGAVEGNYQSANNWLSNQIEEHGAEKSNIITFLF